MSWLRGEEPEHHLVAGVAGVVGRLEGGVAVHSEFADGVATAHRSLTTDGVDLLVIWRPHRATDPHGTRG